MVDLLREPLGRSGLLSGTHPLVAPKGGWYARAEDVGVAPLEEAGDCPFTIESEACPDTHLVALDHREDPLNPLALGNAEDVPALRWIGTGAKIEDSQRARVPVQEKA